MRLEGIEAHPDDVVVTVGSQQAVDLVTRIFCDPGDVVICEAPSYVGALGVFKSFQCDVVHAEMDADGLVPEALRAGDRGHPGGRQDDQVPLHDPELPQPGRRDDVRWPGARRSSRSAAEHDILVLEDNPYGLLGFDAEPMRALRADEPDGVIYLGSFSKTFSPGMRVGWALAPHAVREKLVLAQESATLCPPSFNQMAVSAYLSTHDWQGQIKQMREMYRERRDAMIAALDDFMPASCTWNVPNGGFFVWVTLPPGIDAKAMLPRAVTARVAYVPGTAFFADGFGSSSMRLSFCYPTPERIREGVRRLAGVLEAEMELRATFGRLGRRPASCRAVATTPRAAT